MQNSQNRNFCDDDTNENNVAADGNRPDIATEFRSRLGAFGKVIQQSNSLKNSGAKPLRGSRIFGSDVINNPVKITQRPMAENDFRHITVGA